MAVQNTVQIDVRFRDASNSAAKMIEEFKKSLANVDLGSNFGKQQTRLLNDMEKKAGEIGKTIGQGITTPSGLTTLMRNFEQLSGMASTFQGNFANIQFGDIDTASTAFQALNQEMAQLQANLQAIQGLKVRDLIDPASKAGAALTPETLDKNALQYYEELQQKAAAAAAEVERLRTAQTQVQGTVGRAEKAVAKHSSGDASQDQIRVAASDIVGRGGARASAGTIATNLTNAANSGEFTDQQIQGILAQLGLSKTTLEALRAQGEQAVEERKKIIEEIQQKMDAAKKKQVRDEGRAAQKSIDVSASLTTAQNEASQIQAALQAAEKQAIQAEKTASQLGGKLEKKGAIGPDSIVNRINGLEQRINALAQQLATQAQNQATTGAGNANKAGMDREAQIAADAKAKQDAITAAGDKFSGKVKQLTGYWLNGYRIFRTVTNQIRQAYNEIKDLDAAMTNIAVVTSMSTEDLWGQIGEYMSIARQYGVTTQGVYEVSQLFYQQGLSTSDVMAATTETLKLARVAGMEYAEAADAMTVAIRSFKMEMTDAEHVTDVYAKVAASTASSSEELAIAMSKTASSAESVGSSFENTTAMMAVMIETTRESAQNIGSALKSIISRYGEMKVGVKVDSEGEDLDYNKVDTALQSIGISLKDAQGQFRDFDDVIFELSEKWDGLDKNTQRYIATIMAGNRQQSRFIALVDNYDRLSEVSNISNNAEDAGLLQYSKTLDSLETKLNNIKTSWQQFYMSIFNGPAIKGVLEFIEKLVAGFSKLGDWESILNIVMLIRNIKVIISSLTAMIKPAVSTIAYSVEQSIANLTPKMAQAGLRDGEAYARNFVAAQNAIINGQPAPNPTGAPGSSGAGQNGGPGERPVSTWSWGTTKAGRGMGMGIRIGGAMLGSYFSAKGTAIASEDKEKGALYNGVGNAASFASMGAMMGPAGAGIGTVIGAVISIPSILEAMSQNSKNLEALTKAQEASKEAQTKRAEEKENYSTLESGLEEIKRLEENKDKSQEDYDAWAEANDALVEKYPELFGYMDQYGNRIIDLDKGSATLKSAFIELQKAAKAAAKAQQAELKAEIKTIEDEEYDFDSGVLSDAQAAQVGAGVVGVGGAIGGAALGAKAGGTLGAFLGPVGAVVGGLLGVGLGAIAGLIINEIEENIAGEEVISFVKENISKDGKITNKKLADYMKENDYDPYEIVKKGKAGKLKKGSDEEMLYKVFQGYGIIDKEGEFKAGFEKYWTSYTELLRQQTESINRQNASLGIIIASSGTTSDDAVESLEGYSDLVIAMGLAQGQTLESLMDLTVEQYEKIIAPFVNFYKSLSSANQSKFSDLYRNLGKFTLDELIRELEKFGLKEQDSVAQAYIAQWEQQALQTRQQLFNTIFAPEFVSMGTGKGAAYRENSLEILSYSEWWEKNKTNKTYKNYTEEQKQDAYNRFLTNTIKNYTSKNIQLGDGKGNEQLEEIFLTLFDENGELLISNEEAQSLINFVTNQNDIIRSNSSIFASVAAQARSIPLMDMYSSLSVLDWAGDWGAEVANNEAFDIWGENFDLSKWSAADAQAFQALLVAENVGTIEWQEQMDELAEKYGQTIDWSNEALSSFLYTNFNTQINMLSEEIATFTEDLQSLAKKQSQGFSWKESQELLDELGSNVAWADVFEVNEEGLIVLKDFEKTVADLYNEKERQLNELTSQVTNAQKHENAVDTKEEFEGLSAAINEWYTAANDDGSVTVDETNNILTTLWTDYGIDRELGQLIVDKFLNGSFNTVEEYEAFLNELAEQNAELAEYFRKQRVRAEANASFETYKADRFGAANAALTALTSPSLESLRDLAISSGSIQGTAVYTTNDAGEQVLSHMSYDWASYFDNFAGIEVSPYGEIIITNAQQYAESLATQMGLSNQEITNDIYRAAYEQYGLQYKKRQDELNNFFNDYQFTEEEMIKTFAWAQGAGLITAETSMEEFATSWGFENIDGVWEATSEESYYKMLTAAVAQNPDLDYSDLPSWKEWAANRAAAAREKQENAIKFLREIGQQTGPDSLDKAVEYGLLDYEQISEADLAAFQAGDISLQDLIRFQRPEEGFEDPELEAAWKTGQENSQQEVSKWLVELINKTRLTPQELLEIWELLGSPDDFDSWASTNGFEFDSRTGNYKVTAKSYGAYAQAAAEKGAEVMPSRFDFLQTLLQGNQEQRSAQQKVISSLTMDATIEDLNKAYEAGLITQEQYIAAINNAANGTKSYYESITESLDRTNKETDDAIQEIEATRDTEALSSISSLFDDTVLDNDAIKKMWQDANTDKGMLEWAQEALGVVYKNGEWVIQNVNQAWATMESWFQQEYGEDYQQYMPDQVEFQAMWSNYQDTQDEAIVSFLEGLSPESGENILTEAVELGITNWEEIADYKNRGYDAYTIIRAVTKGSEYEDIVNKGYKQYYQETSKTIEKLFSDGLFTEEDLEGMWLADTDFTGSFDQWMTDSDKGAGAFFTKVADGWVIKSEDAYDQMVQWIADTYGPEFVAALPSYEKLNAMGLLEGKKDKADQLDFIKGLDLDDIGWDDVEKAVELGLMDSNELAAAVQAGLSPSEIVGAIIARGDKDAAAAYRKAQATYLDNTIKEANNFVEKTSWSTEDIVKIFGQNPWEVVTTAIGKGSYQTSSYGFEFDIESGEWRIATKEAYDQLKQWVTDTYGAAYAEMLPSYEELRKSYDFKDLQTKDDTLSIIKGLTADFSLDDLEKLVQAGALSYQQALDIWGKKGQARWEALMTSIKVYSQEELDALNMVYMQAQVTTAETISNLFADSTFTFQEMFELWKDWYATLTPEQIAQGGVDFNTWASHTGLSYIDGSWKITTAEGYQHLVEAAKKIYGDAWASMIPTEAEVLAAGLLDDKISADTKLNIFENLDFDKITWDTVKSLFENGLLSAEQLQWAIESGLTPEQIVEMAAVTDESYVAAYNNGVYKNQQEWQEFAETFFETYTISDDQINTLWEKVKDKNTSYQEWFEKRFEETEDGEIIVKDKAGFELLQADLGVRAVGFTYEDWASGWDDIRAIEKQAKTDKFLSGLSSDAGLDEAKEAIELGILTYEELAYWVSKGFGYYDIITQLAARNENNAQALLESWNTAQSSGIDSIYSLFKDASFTTDELMNAWKVSGSDLDFISWAENSNFQFINGQWKAANDYAWEQIKAYAQQKFGEAYGDWVEDLIDEAKAADWLQEERDQEDVNSFIKGLSYDSDLDAIQQAISLGLFSAEDWQNYVDNMLGGSYTNEDILAFIGTKLTPQEAALLNKTITQANADRMATVSKIFSDNVFTMAEVYEAWESSGQTDIDFEVWAGQQGFILQEDGSYKAAGERAYEAMRTYVKEQFGEAYLRMLPTQAQWETSGLLEDAVSTQSAGDFITSLSQDAGIDDLQKAAEIFGLTFTKEQIDGVLNGTISAYELIMQGLGGSSLYQQMLPNLKEYAANEAVKKLKFGEKITSPKEFNETRQALITIYEHVYKGLANASEEAVKKADEILADGVISLTETKEILATSEYYTGIGNKIDDSGQRLLAAAEAYGLSLQNFFDMSIISPAQVLEELGLKLSELTASQYDTFMTAQKSYSEGIAKLFSGQGTAQNAEKLIAALNNNRSETDYEWSYNDFVITAEGIQLDRTKFFEALNVLKEKDSRLYDSLRETLVSSPELLGEGFNNAMDVLAAINKLHDDVVAGIQEENDALREQASIYGEIYAQMSMKHSKGWDFLNRELHGNAQNFLDWSGSVTGAFQAINSKDGIDPTQFLNMLTYMQQMGVKVETLGGNFATWGDLMTNAYSAFGKATLTGSNIAVADLGISADGMSTAMLDSVQTTAKAQIKFLDSQIAMLEGILALENVDLSSTDNIFDAMSSYINDYNKKMGLTGDDAIDIAKLTVRVGDKDFPFTREGLADAESYFKELYGEGENFGQALKDSYFLNPERLLSGETIEVAPGGEQRLVLSADGTGITQAIEESNNHLMSIQALLQSIVQFLGTGKDPWTVEGGESYLTTLLGTDNDINNMWDEVAKRKASREWSEFDEAIWRNYLIKSGYMEPNAETTPDSLPDTATTAVGENTGVAGSNANGNRNGIITIDGEDYYATRVTEIDGELVREYATGTVDGQGNAIYIQVPKDEGAKASDYQGLWGTASPKAEALEGQDLNGDGKIDDNDSLEDINTAFTNLSGFIFKEGKVYTRNADGSEGAEITDKETLENITANKTLVESYLASGSATTAQMALYWSLMNNPENMPQLYNLQKQIQGEGTETPFDPQAMLSTTNDRLSSIAANTAEAAALLAVMAAGLDINTQEGAQMFLKQMGRGEATDKEAWLRAQSPFVREIAALAMGPVDRGNWGSSVAATNLTIEWEENGFTIPEEDQEVIWELWEEAFPTMNEAPDWAKRYYHMGSGLDKAAVMRDKNFMPWLATTDYGYNHAQSQTDTPKELTREQRQLRINWWEYLTDAQRAAALGVSEAELSTYYSIDPNDPNKQRRIWNYDEIFDREGFEQQYHTSLGQLHETFLDKVTLWQEGNRALAGYEFKDGNWYKKGTEEIADEATSRQLTNYSNQQGSLTTDIVTLGQLLGMNINEDNIYKFGTEDLLLRTNEALVDATKNLNEATGNLVTSSGNLDKSVLRLANTIVAENGLLARYVGINPTRMAQIATGEHGIFNKDESSGFNLYDIEDDLDEMKTRYAVSSEDGDEIINKMSLWNTTLDDYYAKSEELSATKAELEAWTPQAEMDRVEAAQAVISGLNSEIMSLSETIATNEATLGQKQGRREVVVEQLTTIESDIGELQSTWDTNQARIQELEALRSTGELTTEDEIELTRLYGEQRKIEENLNTLYTNRATLLQERNQLDQEIISLESTLKTDYETLQTKNAELALAHTELANAETALATSYYRQAQLEEEYQAGLRELDGLLATLEEIYTYFGMDDEVAGIQALRGQIATEITTSQGRQSTHSANGQTAQGEVTNANEDADQAAAASRTAANGLLAILRAQLESGQWVPFSFEAGLEEAVREGNFFEAASFASQLPSNNVVRQEYEKYLEALELFNEGDLQGAFTTFGEIEGFADVDERLTELNDLINRRLIMPASQGTPGVEPGTQTDSTGTDGNNTGNNTGGNTVRPWEIFFDEGKGKYYLTSGTFMRDGQRLPTQMPTWGSEGTFYKDEYNYYRYGEKYAGDINLRGEKFVIDWDEDGLFNNIANALPDNAEEGQYDGTEFRNGYRIDSPSNADREAQRAELENIMAYNSIIAGRYNDLVEAGFSMEHFIPSYDPNTGLLSIEVDWEGLQTNAPYEAAIFNSLATGTITADIAKTMLEVWDNSNIQWAYHTDEVLNMLREDLNAMFRNAEMYGIEVSQEAIDNVNNIAMSVLELNKYNTDEMAGDKTFSSYINEIMSLLKERKTEAAVDLIQEFMSNLPEGQYSDLETILSSLAINIQQMDIDYQNYSDGIDANVAKIDSLGMAASNNASALSAASTRINQLNFGTGGVAAATGNVSGLALAEGNASLDRLNAGARLAGKTLVGELGPELAVYDGMYHLLGQNGAEFVDLPSDAIVFNHRQTKGIINGQAGYRGTALAEGNADELLGDALVNGNLTGPAFASGAEGTLAQLKSLRAMWQSILGMTAKDLANAGGGGGGGNSLKAVTAELTEWYNLTRQIENLEQEINNLIAERENIAKDNGEAYLRNLRETQKLLQQQKLTQQILLDYQEKQLARQRDHINNHDIWSKFLTIGEDGLLQYIKGNETDDGKGALNVLQQLNKMSGKEQVAFIRELGYSYTDKDGKKLKDSELVSKFFEELQDQIDQYDELYDTVNGTKETIEELTSDIEKINDEILENQKKLEEDVYKILVDAWEKEIEALEEQSKLIEEANKAYVDGLKEALSAEKDLYEKNETTEERESLQRQLSLLRRSGGSASEIADLEEQLNDTLKDEYFKNQERMIENIEDANKEQVRKLEEQITLQKESLEYQKENGVLWTEVYKVLAGTKEEILAFMQGKHTEFFSKSALQQEEMLTDWAHKIGIYTEERRYENSVKAATSIWDSNDLWNGETLKDLKDEYEGLSADQQSTLKDIFTSTYAENINSGVSEPDARAKAEKTVGEYLGRVYKDDGSYEDTGKIGDLTSHSSGSGTVTVTYEVVPEEAKKAGCKITGPSKVQVGQEGKLVFTTPKGWTRLFVNSSDTSIAIVHPEIIKARKAGKVTITARFGPKGDKTTETQPKEKKLAELETRIAKYRADLEKAKGSGAEYSIQQALNAALAERKKLFGYSQGGLVDYTGLAVVHGSKSKPEAFLNASQTAQIKEALEATNGKENLLSGLHSTIDQLRSLIHNISTIDNSTNSSITIAPGAVVINVDQLADSYDVDALSADIMNRMVSIASKATNRGVNRR